MHADKIKNARTVCRRKFSNLHLVETQAEDSMIAKIKRLRKELHRHPEVSGSESQSAARIKSFVEEHNPTHVIEHIGGHGLAVVYTFSDDGPTVAIRCELDALPILEKNDFDYRSTVDGVSHKCGHDGHMAIVAGLIFWIKEQDFKSGKIVLLFQPAEETGQGAYKVLEDPRFAELNIDCIYALHNIPGKPLNSIITMDTGFSAEVQSFILNFHGQESHAAESENGINPAIAMAEMVAGLSQLNVIYPSDENFAILTPVHMTLGQPAYGISPADGELHYTIRTWNSENMTALKAQIEGITEKVCREHNVKSQFTWLEYFPASANDADGNKIVREAATAIKSTAIESAFPFRFGEDFGWFSRKYKAVMFGLGAGEDTPPLHDATYDFPEEIIETGMHMFKMIILKTLNDYHRFSE